MPHVADKPEQHVGAVVGTGHCVPYVQAVTKVGHTSTWRRGELALHGDVAPGTVIATFDASGRYANATDGSSHAAIYLDETPRGSLRVLDCWIEQGRKRPVAERVIRDKAGVGPAADDASRYYVVETAAAEA
jgi:hypothetical protein